MKVSVVNNRQPRSRISNNGVVCLILIILALGSFLSACGNNKNFDSAAWLKGDMRARGRMSEDLVERKILVGKTTDGVQRLLGEPERNYGSVLSYRIDLGWPFKDSKHYGLHVHLDEDRNVREVRIVD